ncbi:MAG TPA: hypothetical protein VFW66_09950 [Gemmatimonadales bacterium]|nr:hypothetical protein [Gemmatimonadales bacterium]
MSARGVSARGVSARSEGVHGAAADAGFVAVAVALSLAVHLAALGFYSDDWDLLARMALAGDQTFGGLYRVLSGEGQLLMRPGQKAYEALLFRAFGLAPLGYHVVNAAVLVLTGVLFLLSLRALGLSRRASVATALLYSLLPHYSSARVWFASFQAPLSMAAYFLSLYAGLRSIRSAGATAWTWLAVSLAGLIASALAYEVALPLFLLNALLYEWRRRSVARARTAHVTVWSTAAAALTVAAFKMLATTRLSGGLTLGYLHGMVEQIARINLWVYGVGAPLTIRAALSGAGAAALLMALALALGTWLYLSAMPLSASAGSGRSPGWLVAGGAAVFLLGHAVFLTTNVSFSATGADNRTAIASAAGLALAWVGIAVWMTERLPKGVTAAWRARAFAGLTAASCAGAFVVSARLARDWGAAYGRARRVVADIRRSFPTLAPGTALVLDGICRYVGPAPVFEAPWDLRGALQLAYGDSTLAADIVSPTLRVEDDGVHTVVYGEDSRYPYGRLVVYDARRHTADTLADARAARAYFAEHGRGDACPPGRPGHGARVF